MRTRVKICGITRPQDALAAAHAGADAIGLVFYGPSPRAVTPAQAIDIVKDLPPFVTVVGLFVNASAEEIAETLAATRIDLLQFHGDETPEQCRDHGRPYIKAIRMRQEVDLHEQQRLFKDAAGLLLDTYEPGKPGGTGNTFDWARIPADLAKGAVLAGGLDASNVEQAIRQVRPYAVDVSGGVEQEKGIKDREKIMAFIRGVERANR
jgi:phosphoribosylanthranilate isomerase